MKILLRATVLLGLFVGQLYAWKLYDGEASDANIGAGLISFGITATAAAVWGGYDASRRPTNLTLRTWAWVAVVFALASSFLPQLREENFDWSVWRSDLVFLATFDFFLVFGPAMMAALVVGSARDHAPGPDVQNRPLNGQ